jgi:ferritin-like metal-binding protein YciE
MGQQWAQIARSKNELLGVRGDRADTNTLCWYRRSAGIAIAKPGCTTSGSQNERCPHATAHHNALYSNEDTMADLNTLQVLFEDELRDVYDAEKQVLKALPKIIKAVTDEDLREALSSHLEETRGQVVRLEKAFESLDLKPRGKHCAGMAGILEEGSDLLEEDGDDAVLDAAFIAGCQRVEHYEIVAYGCLMAWAKLLGYREALSLLKANEQEEKAADLKLSKLAESTVNPNAAAADAEPEMAASGKAPARRRMA